MPPLEPAAPPAGPLLGLGGLVLFCALAAAPAGAEPPAAVEREISSLIDGLAHSPCRFARNGRWYEGPRAAEHLRRKYDYLRRHDLVDSSEQFIERAASRSSVSGQAYRVACPGEPEREAASWFRGRLQHLRHSGPP